MMKTWGVGIVVGLVGYAATTAQAASFYVAQNGQTPGDFMSWAAAASNIQDAVNAATINDTVWVGPGHYYASAAPSNYYGNSVVVIDKALALRSSNGVQAATIIDGGGVNRGVAIKNGATSAYPFIVDGFTITNGFATNFGGGIVASYPSGAVTVMVQNCTITDNRTYDKGGGLYANNYGCQLTVSNCVIRNNMATNGPSAGAQYGGGGLHLTCAALITDSIVHGNRVAVGSSSESGGGGVYFMSGVGHVIRNTLMDNNDVVPGTIALSGSAIYQHMANGAAQSATTLDLINCTITGNRTVGAIYMRRTNYTFSLVNSIIRANAAGDLDAARCFVGTDGTYTNSIITYSCFPTNGITGVLDASNITNYPAFANPNEGDYRLRSYSYGVDAGVTQAWMTGATDLAGQPRVSTNKLVDMGAYETTYTPFLGYFAAHNGQTPVYPYTDWSIAASNIQDAVNVYDVNYPATVWVGPGTYTAPPSPVVYLGTNVLYIDKPLTLRSSSGVPENTIIDGGGVNRGIAIIFPNTPTDRYILDGLTISNCSATVTGAPSIKCYGGGVLFYPASANNIMTSEVRNCVIVNNTVGPDPGGGTGDRGAGLYLGGGNAGYLITNCIIRGNRNGIGYYGGIVGGTKTLVHSCVIEDNSAVRGGGGAGIALYVNTKFIGNAATGGGSSDGGGGVFLGYVTFTNCVAYNNRAAYAGGFVSSDSQGPLSFYSCTIASNSALYTGAIGVGSAAHDLTIQNSIIFSNRSTGNTPWVEFSRPVGSTNYIMNSCFRTNGIRGLIIGSGNITNADPKFADFAAQNFRLAWGSPCINTGSNQAWMVGALDMGGNPRLSPLPDGPVDMGAYEFPIQAGSTFSVR